MCRLGRALTTSLRQHGGGEKGEKIPGGWGGIVESSEGEGYLYISGGPPPPAGAGGGGGGDATPGQ